LQKNVKQGSKLGTEMLCLLRPTNWA